MNISLNTIFISDETSFSSEEIEMIVEDFSEYYHANLNLLHVVNSVRKFLKLDNKKKADLVLIDYGGAGWDVAHFSVELSALASFAEDNPSILFVLVTSYTCSIYQREVEGQFGQIPNLLYKYGDKSCGFRDKFYRWFGIEGEKDDE